jgi:hypothetical protein
MLLVNWDLLPIRQLAAPHEYHAILETIIIRLILCESSQANKIKKTPWLESVSKLYRLSDRRLSAKLVPILADIGCRVVSETNPLGR